uniref:Uncharacterized protein n=1 Tax=Ciona savignyi TaxID=51511 RepID=H2YPL4_CIOSA
MLKVLSVLKCHVKPVHRSFSVSCLKWTYYDILGVKTECKSRGNSRFFPKEIQRPPP